MPAQVTGFTTYPQRTQPATFAADMDTHISELVGFVNELNFVTNEVNVNADRASVSADEAQASAGAAAAIVNVSKWVSGTTYAKDVAVWSPSNLQTYRRKVAGAGTTDPAFDAVNWQQLYPGLDSSCALNYGMTFNGTPLPPLFRMLWGGATDTAWVTIATATFPAGTYRGAAFDVEVIESWYTTTSGNAFNKHSFQVVMCRSEAYDLSSDNAIITGSNAGFCRVVKTQADGVQSVYELQVRQETNYRHMEVRARRTSSAGLSIAWATTYTLGATVGTVYTPTLSTPTFAGGIKFGNAEVADATALDWYEEGNYTGTATGLTTAPTGTVSFVRIGKQVTLQIPANFTGISNATTFSITGMPTNIRPAATRYILLRIVDSGNSAVVMANATVGINGTITMYKDLAAGVFTASGTKSLSPQDGVTYTI